MSARLGRRFAVTSLAVCSLAAASTPAAGDSFTPVTMRVSGAPVARLHGPFPISVSVTADQGVLDVRTAPLRVRIKLADECGGDFTHTAGDVVLDRRLSPQPDPAEPYQGSASGVGRPASYGVQTLCVFLEEEGDNRVFANDTSAQVNVSKPCTTAARRYDGAASDAARAGVALHRAHGQAERKRLQAALSRRRAAADKARRAARSACGPGVPL